jgi:hypothetical protein
MKNLNLQANRDDHVWATINKNIEFETNQREKCFKEIGDLSAVQAKEHFAFVQKCTNKFFEIAAFLPNAVLAVREDLGLPISDAAYKDIFTKHMDRGRRVFVDFVKKVTDE